MAARTKNTEMSLIFAGNLRAARARSGLTQKQVARKIGRRLDGTDVSRWERGVNRPSDKNTAKLCKLFEITFADLYKDEAA